jgi:uncharacterized protein YlzI (FlbEa/FlbD family)
MIQLMKSRSLILENLRRAVPLAISLLAATGLSAKPAIQAVDVNPNPLLLNRAFTVTVAATPDVTFATATLESGRGAIAANSADKAGRGLDRHRRDSLRSAGAEQQGRSEGNGRRD